MQKPSTISEYKQELRHKILETATREFKSRGVKSVKMDDIANILSISKRTMYELYDNKEQLLMEALRQEHARFDAQLKAFIDDGDRHVIDIILQFYRLKMRSLSGVTPNYYTEVQRYPELIAVIEQVRQKRRQDSLMYFKKGVEEGYLRPDANYEILSKVADGMLSYIMQVQLYRQYDLKEIFRNVIIFFLRGVCAPKGIRELERRMDEIE